MRPSASGIAATGGFVRPLGPPAFRRQQQFAESTRPGSKPCRGAGELLENRKSFSLGSVPIPRSAQRHGIPAAGASRNDIGLIGLIGGAPVAARRAKAA
jgi:hypothetical protein